MKRIILLFAIALLALTSMAVDPEGTKVPKALVVGAGKTKTVIDTTEIKSLNGQTTNIATALAGTLKVADGVPAANEFYTKTDANALFSHKLITNYTQHSLVNNNVETVVFTATIPANTLSAGGVLKFMGLFSFANSTNNKYFRVKINGTDVVGYWNTATTGQVAFQGLWHLWLISGNSQIGQSATSSSSNAYAGSTAALATHSLSYAVDWIITVTIQMQVNTETASLEGFRVIYEP